MQAAVLGARNTTAKPATKRRSAPLDPQVAGRLLDLLSSDDKFRALFMRNPREALLQVGCQRDRFGLIIFVFLGAFEAGVQIRYRCSTKRNPKHAHQETGPDNSQPQCWHRGASDASLNLWEWP